jgi:hypothetical protein
MSRLHKVFWHAARGPFTSLKIVLMGAACALGMALTATVFAPVLARVTLPLAMAFAIAVLVCCILLLTLVVARLNEVLAAIALEGSLRRQRLEPPNFFTDGAAATPSLELLLLKVLRFVRPMSILELGSGQSTKLLALYYHETPTSYVLSLEEDASWVKLLEPQITIDGRRHDYRHSPLHETTVMRPGSGGAIQTRWYSDEAAIEGVKFDLVLVDGPATSGDPDAFSRVGIVRHLPAALDTSFVLIFDDAERYGERTTIALVEEALRLGQRTFVRFDLHGIKTQTVICSRDRAFLQCV